MRSSKSFFATAALVFVLSGCGGSSGPSDTDAKQVGEVAMRTLATVESPERVAAQPLTCSQVSGMTVAASAIGLPTSGAKVTSATVVAASGSGATAVGSYCLVAGTIAPVDPTAPNITFNLALPSTWNHKIMMFGGSGTDGSVPSLTASTPQADPTTLTPLGRGYAVFASDSGHQDANSADSSWAVNKEANLNFMGGALKKTHDVALSVIDAFYAVAAPKEAYFAGASTGGREALTVAQRWPSDWNGVIAFYPAWDYTAVSLGQLDAAQAFAAPGAWLDSAKRGVLFKAALAACDALDGVADGVISNVKACLGKFDPSTALLNGMAVRCAGGADTGDTCLSDAQIAAVKKMDSVVPFNTTLASGESSYPGYNALIADLGIPSTIPTESIVSRLALGAVAPAFPITTSMMFDAQISGSWTQYAVVGSSTYDPLTFPISAPGAYTSQLNYLSSLDAYDTNLTSFSSKGGKLLIMHGTADVTVSPRATEYYYAKMQSSMGGAAVAGFSRYYEVPGFQHGISTVFNPTWDNLTELEQWVEAGKAPSSEVVKDTLGVAGRTRPLCVYPAWPKYEGSGDVNTATSYNCAN